ncbi:MAG: glycosyltransferase family 9 protein [Nitrospira sp.]
MRLLIIHPGGIGDVLLALPAIRSLRYRHHADEIGLLAAGQVGRLLRDCHEVDTVFSLESGALTDLLSVGSPRASLFSSWLEGCDLVQCWMADRDGYLAAKLSGQGRRRSNVCSANTLSSNSRHQSDRYLEAAQCSGFEQEEAPLAFPQDMELVGRAALSKAGVSINRPYAVIHPGSGSVHKCCDPALCESIVRWLIQRRLAPLIVHGPADEGQINRVQAVLRQPFHLLEHCDLSTLAWIIKGAALYVGHDSGITHLAAALGVPTVACFGQTDEARWAPRGQRVLIMRGAACHCVDWDAVQQCRDKSCLKISSASLIQKCEAILEGN